MGVVCPVSNRQAKKEDCGMATSVELEESRRAWAPPATKPLDEAVWQAWVSKGRAQDRRSRAALIKVIKWAGVAGLIAAAGFWFHLAAAPLGTDSGPHPGVCMSPSASRAAMDHLGLRRSSPASPATVVSFCLEPRATKEMPNERGTRT